MLTYKRIFNKNGVMRYEYYPNGDEAASGIVEFVNGESPKLIKESEVDFKRMFASHAMYHIDVTRERGTIAWY